MKNIIIIISIAILIGSCKKDERSIGQVTFGANAHLISEPMSGLTIYIDGAPLGKITKQSDSITSCGLSGNATKETCVGNHSYFFKIAIPTTNPDSLAFITSDTLTFMIKENECTKILIDLQTVDFSNTDDPPM